MAEQKITEKKIALWNKQGNGKYARNVHCKKLEGGSGGTCGAGPGKTRYPRKHGKD